MSDVRTRVLVVEDEAPMRRFLRASLASHGYDVVLTSTVAEALARATEQPPDVVLLDLGLPDGDGLSLAEQLREWSTVPIIVVSARGREDDKVAALDRGADDYLTKPFGVNELLARLRAVLRRAARTEASPSVLRVGQLEVDVPRHVVSVRGAPAHLTPNEFRLLVVLARHAGRVVTHRQLLRDVWGPHAVSQSHYLRVYMTHLRRKLELDPARPRLLRNEPGVGYRLDDGEP